MPLTQKQIEDFWTLADENKDDNLTIQELARAVRKYDKSISDAAIAGMFCSIDADQSRRVTKREFMKDMVERESRSAAMDKLFKKYDTNNNNKLSRGEAMELIKKSFSEDQVHSIIGTFLAHSDKNGDGVITYNEFREFFG